MDTSIRFENMTLTAQTAFLNDARSRHPDIDPTGPAYFLDLPYWLPGWGCGRCLWGYPLADVLVVEGEPQCPHCGETGWYHVQPRSMLRRNDAP